MNIIPIIKLGAGLVTSFGAGAVVGNAIIATTPKTLSVGAKILISIGGATIAAAAGGLAADYVEDSIQGLADGIKVASKLKDAFTPGATDDLKAAAADVAEATENLAQETKKVVEDGIERATKPETDAS